MFLRLTPLVTVFASSVTGGCMTSDDARATTVSGEDACRPCRIFVSREGRFEADCRESGIEAAARPERPALA